MRAPGIHRAEVTRRKKDLFMLARSKVTFSGHALLVLLSSLVAACSTSSSSESSSTSSALATCPGACDTGGSLDGTSLLVPVTREKGLNPGWVPNTEALPDSYRINAAWSLRPAAADAFVRMLKDAYDQGGVDMYCMSGYRSFDDQCGIFASYAAQNGCDQANTFSAHAGHSEHQLGTVCDIAYHGDFLAKESPADLWLTAHAQTYGFVNSYPNGDASLNDGYIQEPWHYRYVGVAAAAELKRREAAQNRRISTPEFTSSLSGAEVQALGGGGGVPGSNSGANSGGNSGGNSGDGNSCTVTPDGRCSGTTLTWLKDGSETTFECTGSPTGSTQCGIDPNGGGFNCVTPVDDPCRGVDQHGRCNGALLEWCVNGVYHGVSCATCPGRTTCGADPQDPGGFNCVGP
jgi:D-alanyl-D-alanine carboxypeptidase